VSKDVRRVQLVFGNGLWRGLIEHFGGLVVEVVFFDGKEFDSVFLDQSVGLVYVLMTGNLKWKSSLKLMIKRIVESFLIRKGMLCQP
jgi:hypothetical protein